MLWRQIWPVLLSIGFTAHADFAPSVWLQLQTQSTATLAEQAAVHAKIDDLTYVSENILVSYLELGIQNQKSLYFCPLVNSSTLDPLHFATYQEQMETLRRAIKSARPITLEISRPWSPCIKSIHDP